MAWCLAWKFSIYNRLVFPFGSVIRAFHKHEPKKKLNSIHQIKKFVECNFLIKIFLAVAQSFGDDLLLIDYVAVPKTVWNDTSYVLLALDNSVSTTASFHFFFILFSSHEFYLCWLDLYAIWRKIIFYGWFVQK